MKALVIDGNSLIYRAYYATENQLDYYLKNNLPPLNALKLVLNIILKLTKETEYQYALIAFDHQKKTIKHEQYADYKAGRKPMPEALISQLPLIYQTIKLLGIETMSMEGIEADDLVASVTKLFNDQNISVDIYSSDKDLLQLVNKLTNVNLFKVGISNLLQVNENNFTQNFYGLTPSQVPDFKGIAGDTSDNLKGVKGVGPVTASKLILQYGSLENIYDNIKDLSEHQQKIFLECKEHAMLCKKIATLNLNILSDANVKQFIKLPIDVNTLKEIINKYHFSGFEKYI